MIIQFGDYQLIPSNGVYTKGWRELHGPERALTILKSVGSRGVKVLNSVFEEKVLELQGELIFSDSEALITGVRNFVKQMAQNGQPLKVTNEDGEFVYDGVYVTNLAEITSIRDYDFQRSIEFRIIFLCPKGFARSTTQSTHTFNEIDETPYTTSITIDSEVEPEPIFQLTFVDASTIADVTITNQTTNETIELTGLTLINGDIITIDTGLKEVRLNSTPIIFEGVFPSLSIGENNIQVTVQEDTSGITEQQLTYDSEYALYGSRMISQKITAAGTGVRTAIESLIKRVVSIVDVVYQEFSSDYSGFTVSGESGPGQVYVSGDALNIKISPGQSTTSLTQNANLSSAGDGVRVHVGVQQGGNTGDANAGYVEYTDLTDYIRVRSSLDSSNQFNSIISTAYYGSLNISISGNGELKIIQVGADIQVWWAGVLQATIPNTTLKANSRIKYNVIAGSSANNHIASSYVYRIVNTNSNGDIELEIQTDSTGEPSGTPVTNGTVTIPASSIGTDAFSAIIAAFATALSLTNTTVYHIVMSQAGGDINNYYLVKKSSTGGYSGGNILTSTDGGSTWVDVSGEDTYFKVYGDVPAAFDLTLVISYFKSIFNIA